MPPTNRSAELKPETYTRLTALLKARFNTLKGIVDEINTHPDIITAIQVRSLKTYLSEINRKHEDFEQNLLRISASIEDEIISDASLIEDQNTIEELFVYLTSTIETLLNNINELNEQTNGSVSPADPNNHNPFIANGNKLVARLPKLELIKFHGDFATWTTFINLFNTTIHVNQSLNKTIKFQYLLSVLSGEPLNLIRNLSLTEANYDIAYGLLQDRYQNDRRLQLMHINRVIDLPDISIRNINGIRQFLNVYHENIQALDAISCDITEPNSLLSAILLRKLDVELRKRLELARDSNREEAHTLPTVRQIIDFLTKECARHEDAVYPLSNHVHQIHILDKFGKNVYHTKNNSKNVVATTTPIETKGGLCPACHESGHKLFSCPIFLSKGPQERYQFVKSHNQCICCLGMHNVRDCKSKSTCKTCHKKHNSLLHFPSEKPEILSNVMSSNVQSSNQDLTNNGIVTPNSSNKSVTLYSQNQTTSQTKNVMVLLGTVLVNLRSSNGITNTFRALLDSGSMCTLITERAVNLLNAQRHDCDIQILGINQQMSQNKGQICATLETLSGHQIVSDHPMIILDKLTINLPRLPVSPEVILHTQQYELADPTFHCPNRIDLIIGAAVFPQIFTGKQISLGYALPSLIDTVFGHVVMGTTPCVPSLSTSLSVQSSTLNVCFHSVDDTNLHNSIQRFWVQEELPPCSNQSKEDIACEQFFNETHSREDSGRYVVRLPFKETNIKLGSSHHAAEIRLKAMEKRFVTNERFATLYRDFMNEYITLGHMTERDPKIVLGEHFFLPHHGILKETSSTTKLRTVFDASCKTSSGSSLNDSLMTGIKLQTNISDILIQFRHHQVVLCCDIKQMYRQISVHPDDRDFQLILWRATTDQDIKCYQLNTVTYGVNSSPYLAIRTLHQLAIDEGHDFPNAAHALLHNTYVDDIITGAESEEAAIEMRDQLTELLKRGGFELRKWVSNSNLLLSPFPDSYLETPTFISEEINPQFTILGLKWSPSSDTFSYNTCTINDNTTPTKRTVLSTIAKIYDPCGFLTPFIMLAKCFMQLIWTLGLSWDAQLPSDVHNQWKRFTNDTCWLSQISIPRALNLSSQTKLELHGFCDASEHGYAAVVYLKCEQLDHTTSVHLITAKSRVAPLKRVTIPRLELCAAHLLARLISHCITLFASHVTAEHVYLWSDSTVTLSWIRTPPYRLKTYVANRVSQIQELTAPDTWNHVSSEDNPADCASRGLFLSNLIHHSLWWNGPQWLTLPSTDWPTKKIPEISTESDELKTNPLPVFITEQRTDWSFLTSFSSWTLLVRIMARILRFTHNCKHHTTSRLNNLTIQELHEAKLKIFFAVQQTTLRQEYNEIKQNNCSIRLLKLNPFIDENQLIRVGGRLNKSSLPYDVKHPILLPKHHHIVNILIDYIHLQHLHAGTQLVHSILMQQVWILNARSVIRSRIHKCITCFRAHPTNITPIMGDLPSVRTEPAKPFASTGIDYCGPFSVKIAHLRFLRQVKVYLCIFICMVTKAVHIEVVTDMTTDAFIAALTRFISRRGVCSDIYSDCGTTFVGANLQFRKIIKSIIEDNQAQREIKNFTSPLSLQFHFNPPAAPHHGGLWESAVKNVKHHLFRVMGTTILTLPEFITLSTRIEAMLNSRPLTPLSNDPNDLSVLTPGHFLTGGPLTSLPEINITSTPLNRLKYWQLQQQFFQRIWKRWSAEYLHTLQQRTKWTKKSSNLSVGDLVLLKTTSTPLYWPLARIIEIFPGTDGIVRVVKVKSKEGTYIRPVTQLFPLPATEDSSLKSCNTSTGPVC